MDTELFDPTKMMNKAPDELKEKMAKASVSFRRLVLAEKQESAWKQELALAKQEREATLNDLNSALDRWNPETNAMDDLELKQ